MGSFDADAKLPDLKDLTTDNLTENVILMNSSVNDSRLKYILERLTHHLHEFARETRLSIPEWMAGINFLIEVGKISTDFRNEFILLSDIFGLSSLVESIAHPRLPGSTEGTVLGPFYTHDAENIDHGAEIFDDPNGKPLLVLCTVKDQQGKPVEGVRIDVWGNDSHGNYDVQYADRSSPNGRGILHSDADGFFWFKSVEPIAYPLPMDGPVGRLLRKLSRPEYRPAHVHFMFEKEGYDRLVTTLYIRGDPYQKTDPVFAVKYPLIVDLKKADADLAREYQIPEGSSVMQYDFVLVTEGECQTLRNRNAIEALGEGRSKIQIVNGLPVQDME